MNVRDIKVTDNIESIYQYRLTIKSAKKHKKFVEEVRDKVQQEAVEAIKNNFKNCIVAMATGAGKSKVAIDYAKKHSDNTALVVPTAKLRDDNWKKEFEKWGEDYNKVTKLCYASATKYKNQKYDLTILDEGHNITENNQSFVTDNKARKTILLTATVPRKKDNQTKHDLLQDLGFSIAFELTLDDCIKLGFVAPYTINIVEVPLENSKKTVKAGSKKKPFMTTERGNYDYLSKSIMKAMYTPQGAKFMIMNRMRFIYNLQSKHEATKYILDNFVSEEERTLIFASNIQRAEDLCKYSYHSKSNSDAYNAFKDEEINRLSCVKAINEGENFNAVDTAVIQQLTSKEKDLIQRIGRIIRYRPGHRGNIWIVVASGTQDEKWLNKAIENLDSNNIYYYNYKNIDKYEELNN